MLLTSKTFFPPNNLPVRLFFTHESHNLDWHSHEFTEIAIMFGGKARYETDFGSKEITRGDVLVITPGGLHRYRNEKDVNLMNILFKFDSLPIPCQAISYHPGFSAIFRIRSDYNRKMNFYPDFRVDEATIARLYTILYPTWEDQENEQNKSVLSVYGAFLQIIPLLLRGWDNQSEKVFKSIPGRLTSAIDFMTHNFRKPLTVSELASLARLGEATFTRHFKAATGQTPINYLVQLRLQEAAALIIDNIPISEAASQAGFTDTNYFSRVFRKYYGKPPSKIRNLSI